MGGARGPRLGPGSAVRARPDPLALGAWDRRAREDRCAELELEAAASGQRAIVLERFLGRGRDPGARAYRPHAPLPLGGRRQEGVAGAERRGRHALQQFARLGGDRDPMRLVFRGLEQDAVAGRDQGYAQRSRGGRALPQGCSLSGEAADAHPEPAARAIGA